MKIVSDKPVSLVLKAVNSDQKTSSSSDSASNFFTDLMKSVSSDEGPQKESEIAQTSVSLEEDERSDDEEAQARLLASLGLIQDTPPDLDSLKAQKENLLDETKSNLLSNLKTSEEINTIDTSPKTQAVNQAQALSPSQMMNYELMNDSQAINNSQAVSGLQVAGGPQVASGSQVVSNSQASELSKSQLFDLKQNGTLTDWVQLEKNKTEEKSVIPLDDNSKELLTITKPQNTLDTNQKMDVSYGDARGKKKSVDLTMSKIIANDVTELSVPDKAIKQKPDILAKSDQDKPFNLPVFPSIAQDSQPTVTFLQPLKQLMLAQDNQHTKYINALTQMGSMINAQTSNYGANNASQLSMSATVSERNRFAESLEKAQLSSDYLMNVEITPASATSIAKEVYDAKIQIHPPELGQVIAKLKIDKNSAELIILTESDHVKHIVESNLPQLREHFSRSDINLTTVHVQTSNSQSNESGNNKNSNGESEKYIAENSYEEDKKQTNSPEKANKISDKIIDTYA